MISVTANDSATIIRAPLWRPQMSERELCIRAETVEKIALGYHDFIAAAGPSGIRGSGNRSPRMPETYTRSVREYERLMRVLRAGGKIIHFADKSFTRRELWFHVKGWYEDATPVMKLAYEKHTAHGRTPVLDERGWPRRHRRGEKAVRNADGSPTRMLVRCYRRVPGSLEATAQRGLRWIAGEFKFDPVDPVVEASKREAA